MQAHITVERRSKSNSEDMDHHRLKDSGINNSSNNMDLLREDIINLNNRVPCIMDNSLTVNNNMVNRSTADNHKAIMGTRVVVLAEVFVPVSWLRWLVAAAWTFCFKRKSWAMFA